MRSLRTACAALLLAASACATQPTVPVPSAAPADESPSAADRLFLGAYQLNAEPHYRLIFEGGVTTTVLDRVRVLDVGGAVIATTLFSASATDPMRLCAGGKKPGTVTPGPSGYGPWRATLPVDATVFRDFLNSPSSYRVEAEVAGAWRTMALTYVCAASE